MFHVEHPRGLRGSHLGGVDHHVTIRLFALTVAHEPSRSPDVVDDLALERIHRFERDWRTGLLDPCDGLTSHLRQGHPPPSPVTGDVQHQPTPLTGPCLHSQASQLLQRIQNLASAPTNRFRSRPAEPSATIATAALAWSTSMSMSPSR